MNYALKLIIFLFIYFRSELWFDRWFVSDPYIPIPRYIQLADNFQSRYWYGYVFRGGPTDESFYVRDDDAASNVTQSKAWTIVE